MRVDVLLVALPATLLAGVQPAAPQSWTLDVGAAATALPQHPGSRHTVMRVLPIASPLIQTGELRQVTAGLRYRFRANDGAGRN